jgi:hypothetical protein
MQLPRIRLVAFLFLAALSSASAELVTWTLRGTVGSIGDPGMPAAWAEDVKAGDAFQLAFHADTTAPATFSFPSLGITTFDLLDAAFDLGPHHFELSFASVALADDPNTLPTYIYLGGASPSPHFSVTVRLGSSQDLIENFNFPTTLPALSLFDLDAALFVMESGPSDERWEATGRVTELQTIASAVPEPSSYGLLAGLSAAGLCFHRRKNLPSAI